MPFVPGEIPKGAIPFQKGDERINLNGRPKKWITTLKEQGYTKSQVTDTIQVMLNLSLEELKDMYESPNTNILEKTVAHALKKSLEKGSLYSIETLLTRVYGQPKQEIEAQVNITAFKVKFNDGNNISEGGL